MKKRTGFFWAELIVGVLTVCLGIVTIVRPADAISAIVVIYALLALITGISNIVFYIKTEKHMGLAPGLSLASGIVGTMVGITFLIFPGAGTWLISVLFAVWFIAYCIFRLANLGFVRATAGKFYFIFSLVANVLGLALGIMMIVKPAISTFTIGAIIGAALIVMGVDSIVIGCSKLGNKW